MDWLVLAATMLLAAAGVAAWSAVRFERLRRRVASDARRHRMQVDEQMRRANAVESLGVLAGGMAHDLNNLLVPVLANAELLEDRLQSDPMALSLVQDVRAAAERASDLTRRMLAYAAHERVELERVDLTGLAADTARTLTAMVRNHARLDLELIHGALFVVADAVQIRQALLNLVLNAAEALEARRGRIVLRVGTARVTDAELTCALHGDDARPGEYAFLEVEDDGPGMAPAVLEHVFDPLFSTKNQGHGLGLPVVLGVARSHGGLVVIDSREGVGTRIRVCLPRASAVELPAMQPGLLAHAGSAAALGAS